MLFDEFPYAPISCSVTAGGLTIVANNHKPLEIAVLRISCYEESVNLMELLVAVLVFKTVTVLMIN